MFQRPESEDPAVRTELDARAEVVAREAAQAWTGWVEQQIANA
jgi:hypothetical protein